MSNQTLKDDDPMMGNGPQSYLYKMLEEHLANTNQTLEQLLESSLTNTMVSTAGDMDPATRGKFYKKPLAAMSKVGRGSYNLFRGYYSFLGKRAGNLMGAGAGAFGGLAGVVKSKLSATKASKEVAMDLHDPDTNELLLKASDLVNGLSLIHI